MKNYIVTGFPRNDYLMSPKFSCSDLLQKLGLDINIQTVIVFAPTHRNSSQADIKLDAVNFLSLIQAILPILQDNNAAIVLANHPASGNDLNEVSDFCNAHGLICLLSVYESISIYDVMAHTDLLISDYSSIYFDFLLLARPVIFYFSDFSKYQDVRSFSYDLWIPYVQVQFATTMINYCILLKDFLITHCSSKINTLKSFFGCGSYQISIAMHFPLLE